MDGLYSRRAVVTRGSALVAALTGLASFAAPGWAKKGGPKTRNVWRLDPKAGRGCKKGDTSGGCIGCNACVKHAKNKRYPTKKAANNHRAHVGCKCKVRKGGKISLDAYKQLFGKPGDLKRKQIDLRNDRRLEVFQAGRQAIKG